jgi:exodeoxyribonuclease-3
MDFEGRTVRVDFDQLSVMSLYCHREPTIRTDNHVHGRFSRLYYYFKERRNSNMVICGDYNICHEANDIHDPIRNKNVDFFAC